MSHRTIHPVNNPNASRTVTFRTRSPIYTPSSSGTPSSSVLGERNIIPAQSGTAESKPVQAEEGGLSDWDSDFEDMEDRRPPLHMPTDGRSAQPLLGKQDEERGRTGYNEASRAAPRPPLFTRRSTMRSRSPDTQARLAAKKKYTYAAFFLLLSLISFTVQTETAVYIQHELKWDKAYCMLYV